MLLGNGNGTFQAQVDYATGVAPHSVGIGDLNGDGRLDLVTANHSSDTVSILLGNGNGTFQAKTDLATGADPHNLKLADLNGDGRLDLVVVGDVANVASVFIGNGNGTFQARTDLVTGITPKTVVLTDVDGNGTIDIVTANIRGNYPDLVNPGGDSVSILLGNGNGTFQGKLDVSVGQGPFGLAVADVNGDGSKDIVTGNWHDATITTRLRLP